MRYLLSLLLFTLATAFAQTPPSDLQGAPLRAWLKQNFYTGKHQTLSYQDARRRMYNFIDNKGGVVTCVYGGLEKAIPFGGSVSNPMPINAEHTVPQSSFNKRSPMRSDIHHLFPTQKDLNSRRSNFPFTEVDDEEALWLIGDHETRSTIPSANKHRYSESARRQFEPPEAHKGNTARAVFYFYTMYPQFQLSTVGDLDMFYAWHLSDPVDTVERDRNDGIQQHQGNRNPFVDHPEWVKAAWNPNLADALSILTSMGIDARLANGRIVIGDDTGGGPDDDSRGTEEEPETPPVTRGDRRTDKNKLSISTFNVELMWDGIDPEEGRIDFRRKGDPQAAEAHMKHIAEVIARVDADMVNLVEVENLDALTLLNNRHLAGKGYLPYLITGADSFTGQDVGLLTRVDPELMDRHFEKGESEGREKSVSKNYYATFHINNRKIALLGLHFLANPSNTDRRTQRQAQADAIRDRAVLLQEDGYQLVVLGDVNDYDGDVPDRMGSQPISQVMNILKEVDPDDEDDDLLNVAVFLPQEERYTSHWDRNRDNRVQEDSEFTSIDHILVSSSLNDKVASVAIDQTHNPTEVSDHFPLTVTFDFKKEDAPPLTGRVRIKSLFPNPDGDERQRESAMIVNETNAAVSLVGWVLKDRAGKTWRLDSLGTLAPGEVKAILRLGQPMALNNGGDRVHLMDPDKTTVDTVSYSRAREGDVLEF